MKSEAGNKKSSEKPSDSASRTQVLTPRKARLNDALRANLRRRKAPKSAVSPDTLGED